MGRMGQRLVTIVLIVSFVLSPAWSYAGQARWLAKSSMFAKQGILEQRLLQVAQMLKDFLSHDIALDKDLIERIRQADQRLRGQLVRDYRVEQRLLFDFYAIGNVVLMTLRLGEHRRIVAFYDEDNSPLEELTALGFTLDQPVSGGYLMLPENIDEISKAKELLVQYRMAVQSFTNEADQLVLAHAVQDAVNHFLPDLSSNEKSNLVRTMVSRFRSFSLLKYSVLLLVVQLSQIIPIGFVIWHVLSPWTLGIAMTTWAITYLRDIRDLMRRRGDIGATLVIPCSKPLIFLEINDQSFQRYAVVRQTVGHECVHWLKKMGLIKNDLPAAVAYQVYLILVGCDGERRSLRRAEKLPPDNFLMTLEEIEKYDADTYFGVMQGISGMPHGEALDDSMYENSLDRAFPRLRGWRLTQFLWSATEKENDDVCILGSMYAGLAYTYAIRANNPRAGFEFIRLMSQGAGLEKIAAHLHQKYRLAPIESLHRELIPSVECHALISGSA